MEPITNTILATVVQIVQTLSVTNVMYPGHWEQGPCPDRMPGCAAYHANWVQDQNPSWRKIEVETIREFISTVREFGLAATNRTVVAKTKPKYEILGKQWVEAPDKWEPPSQVGDINWIQPITVPSIGGGPESITWTLSSTNANIVTFGGLQTNVAISIEDLKRALKE